MPPLIFRGQMVEKQIFVARTTDARASAWERQKLLVKQEQEAVATANDAKTARLKALRLEREKQEVDASAKAQMPRKSGR
jgi:hypothetical protein